jgi:hypothetical protein
MASNIAIYYRFDTDDVINNTMRNAVSGTYDATVMPETITTANYFIGKSALNIDARNFQYMTMPSSLTIPQSGFSIAFWLSANTINDTNANVLEFSNTSGAYGTGKYALIFRILGGSTIGFRYYHSSTSTTGAVTSISKVEDNIWRHILLTFTSSNVVSLYINGKLEDRGTSTNYPFSTTYSTSYIGRNTTTTPYYFTGSIDDFRIYSYAITSEADINYLVYYPNYNIYTTSPSQTSLLGNTVSNFYDSNSVNISQTYTPRTILPGTIILVSGKPFNNFDTGDLNAVSTTYVLPVHCVFDTVYRNLYVCDQGAGKLKKINMYSGVVNTIYTYTNVNSVVFDVSGINYYLTGQSYIQQIDLSTNTFQQNINTNALINTNFGLSDNSNNLFISHATGIAKINLSGSLPTATSVVITTTIQMEQMTFKTSSQTNIYAIDASNTWIYVINKTSNANYKITLPSATFSNNTATNFSGLVFDSLDNLYVSCINGNNNIYMIPYYVINAISTDTTLTTSQYVLYAGTSSFGYSGDGGQCINAQFMSIANLSIDAGDNLYIIDSGSSTIRKIINGGARKTNFMNLITNETSVVSKTASDLKTVYSGIYSIGSAGPSAMNYSNYCINNTSTTIETELQAATYNVVDNSGLLIYYKFNTMDTSGIQLANYSAGMPIFDASMSDVTLCSSNDSVMESGALTMSVTSIGTWSAIDSLPRSSLLLPNNPSSYQGASFGSWNGVAVSQNGLYVAGVGDFHNFYTNYNTNYGIFSQLYTVPTVELVGGTGTLAYAGDGGIVTKAQFNNNIGNFLFTNTGYYISNTYAIRFVNNQSIISTICGGATATSTGNFGFATAATINVVYSICQDVSKNFIYVLEYTGNLVRRIDKNGIITPFCGTGTASSTGDGGPATLATINAPWGMAIDTSNNIYICEDTGARIRMIDFSTNIITTLAGTGTAGFNDNVAGSSAQFNRPLRAVLDASRNMYITDYLNNRIRKITSVNGVLSSSCIVSTISGTGTQTSTGDGGLATAATVCRPIGIDFNSDYSYLYIGQNTPSFYMRSINMKSGIINTVFGTGVAGAATGNGGNPLLATSPSVYEINFDPSNNLYFGSGFTLGYVRRLTSLTSFPPFSKQPYDQVWALYGLSWKYIAMSGTGQYQIAYMNNFGTYLSNGYGSINSWDYIVDLSGIYTNSAALSYTGQYQSVMDVYGNIYVSSAYGVNSSWTQKYVNTRNTNFTPMPAKIACSFDGRYQVATAFRHQQCVKIAGTGTPGFSGDSGQATAAQFNYDMRVRFDSSNNLIISDTYNHRVRKITTKTGIVTTIAGTGTAGFPAAGGTATAVNLQYPFGLIVDISNNYYITSYHGLLKVTGTTLAILGGSGTVGFSGDGAALSAATGFSNPGKMCCDSFNNIYIPMQNAVATSHRLRKITASTNFVSTICGTGTASSTGDGGLATSATINNPSAVCCDSFNNIYIAESGGNRIRKIDALSGIISTICGTGTNTSTGDGGKASVATISTTQDLYVDRVNNLYIADYGGNRVRKVTARNGVIDGNCIITTYAGNGTLTTGGDNGLPTQLGLGFATSVSMDNYDNVYLYNNNACILYKATQYANIIVSSNYGQTWTDVTTNITGNIAFNNVAVSQTGQYMTATALNGRIYRSTNYGALSSWAASNSSVDNWGSVVVSSTGQYQVAAGYDMSGVYSTDYGLNWTANGMPNGNWSSLALSESTNTLYAVSKNTGPSGTTIYKNTAFNLPNSGLNSEWVTIHNPTLKSASWPTVNGVSFSFWCKSNINSTNARLFDLGNGQAANNIIMFIYANNLAFSVYNGATGNDQNTGIQINDNTWRHVSWTMTYDVSINSIYTIYINGVNVYQQTNQTFTYYPNSTARQNCFIGKSNWTTINDPSFNGVIDDFRIYNRVLSAQEVFKIYSPNECAHYYKFDSDYDYTNTQLANYNTLKPTYNGTQYTQDPSPPIVTTATTVSFGTYTILKPSVVNNLFGMAVTQNNKRILTIENNSTLFAFSNYNTNIKVWNTFTSVTITSLFWTGIKTSADGYIVVMCACTTQGTAGGLYYSIWNGTTYSAVVTIDSSPITTPRFYSGIELTANGNRLIAIADYVYFATWDADTANFINLTATTLAVGSSFITYDSSLSKKDNIFGALACNADGSRIAYANSNNEIYFATWNGTTYVSPTLIAVLSPYVTGITMSADGNLLFYSNVSDFSQKIYYSIWNGTAYTVQTELSYNFVNTANSTPTDGLPLFTPASTLILALSYDMSTLYIATNSNSAYLDRTASRNTIGYIYSLPLTYTNTSAMTKKVGTNSLVVQRQNTTTSPFSYSYVSSTAVTQPFTVSTIGANDISITSNKLRAVICGRSTGYIYVSTYSTSTSTWSALVAQTNQTAFTTNTLISAKITSDGSRGIAITSSAASSCYFFTWNGSSYSAFTATLGTTGTFQSCAITSNGSRIFVIKDGFINYADWNGSNYGAWTNTNIAAITTVSSNGTGTNIVYIKTTLTMYIATYNGTSYIEQPIIFTAGTTITTLRMNRTGNIIGYSTTSGMFLLTLINRSWGAFSSISVTNGQYNGFEITDDNTTVYAVAYVVSAGTIYTSVLTLTNTNSVYIPYLTPYTLPFTIGTIGSQAITTIQDNSRIVIGGYTAGRMYYSTYNRNTGLYSSLISTLNPAVAASSVDAIKLTADGSRAVIACRVATVGCFFSTWLPDQNNYSTWTATLGSTTQTPATLDMTTNGSRIIITTSANGIFYADWNGSNYGTWISIGITTGTINTNNIGISGDGLRIVYCVNNATVLSWALWNGYTYIIQGTTFGTMNGAIRTIRLNCDGSILFYNNDITTTRYCFWNGSGYSNAVIPPASAIPGSLDGWGLATTYDLKNIFVVGYTVSAGQVYQTTTDLKAPTQVSALTIPDTKTFIKSPPVYTVTQPFSAPIGIYGFSITQDGLRSVVVNATTVYVSTFNGSTWSTMTATNATTTGTTFNNVKLTADGSRGVTISRGGTGFAYFFTWTGSTYSTFTQTLGATSTTYQAIDMTSDGSRIFTVDAAFVKYADWNGSNYSTWTNTSFAGSATTQSCAVGCSSDGNKIVYCCNTTTLNYALWNGSSYVLQSTFGSVTLGGARIRCIRFSYDGRYVFGSHSSSLPNLFYSAWNGTTFGDSNYITVTGMTLTDSYPLAVSYSNPSNVYIGNYSAATSNRMFQVTGITMQPFTAPTSLLGISITQDGLRAVVNSDTAIYVSTYSNSVWSNLTATSATAPSAFLINNKITADGSRGVTVSRGFTNTAYFFTWTGSTYSSLTTFGATSTSYSQIDMTTDGSRVFTVDANFVKYADWNGTTYGAWTNTTIVGSAGGTAAIGCSADGYRIVYYCNTATLSYAAWNGSSYVALSTFGTVSAGNLNTIRFSYDGNYVFYSSTAIPNVQYSIWTGTTFGNTNSIYLTGIQAPNAFPLAISYDFTTIYSGAYSTVYTNALYQVPLTLQTIAPNTAGISFSYWVKSIASPDYGGLISLQSIYGWILMYMIGNNVYAAINEKKPTLPASIYPTSVTKNSVNVATITQYTWTHIAWTIDQENTNYDVSGAAIWTVYVNGNSVYRNTNQIYPYPGTRTTNFVGYNGQSNVFMNGNMDDYRAYNRVLSAKDVYNIYINSPNVTYEKTANIPAGLQSEIGGTYTFTAGNAIPTLVNYTTVYRDVSAIPIQNGAYVLSNSGNLVGVYWYNAFDNDSSTFSQTTQTSYSTTTGVYIGTITTRIQGVGDVSGEWQQIQVPYLLQVSSYIITNRASFEMRFPGTWYLVGSNDGANWYPVDYNTGYVYVQDTVTFTPNQSNTNYYSYFRFVWIIVGGTPYTTNRSAINLTAVQFSGAARYLNYYYYSPSLLNNAIPTLTSLTSLYNSDSTPIQNGTYILSDSGNYQTFYLYNAFDNNPSTFSHTRGGLYNSTTGVYIGTINTTIQGVGNVSGEWQQIQIPFVLQVTSYTITNRTSWPQRFPGSWYLVGSNDGTNWYPVDYNTGYVYVQNTVTFTPNQNNTNYYSYLRFVWIVVGGTGYSTGRESINLVAIQFSGVVSKTYIPRLQSDNFSTWRVAIDNTTRNWNNAAISNEGTILATVQTQATVYRSIDYGLTWALYGTSTTSARQVAIASTGTNATIADFASTFLRYSTNGGTTWTAAATTSKWNLVAMNSAGTKTTFGTDGSGNFYSTAIGQTVVASSGGLTTTNNGIYMSSSGTYCLTTYNTTTTIYRSASSGAAYAASSSASAIWSSCAIEDTGLAFAFTTAGQLYRSTDFGVNWSTVASHPVEGASSVSISTSGQYILTTTPYNIYFSNDYGVTFSLKSIIPFTSATTPQISISRDGRIAAATTTNGKLFIARL